MEPDYQGFSRFLKERSSRPLREATLQAYAHATRSMVRKHGLDLGRLSDTEHIRTVITSIENSNVSAQTLNLYAPIIRSWLEYRNVPISDEVKRLLRHRTGPRSRLLHPKDLITKEELTDICRHMRSLSIIAYLWVLYDSASRPGALCNANISDLSEDRNGFVITFARGTKTESSKRPVRLLMPESIAALEKWLSVHPDRLTPTARYSSTEGKAVSIRNI